MRAPDALIGLVEIGLNRTLALDPAALADCARLDGRVLALQLREFDFTLYLLPGPGGIRVSGADPGKVDAWLAGSLPAFGRLMLVPAGQAELLLGGAVRMQGDVELAEQFADLLRRARFDPEELLAGQIGGVAAHGVMRFLRGAAGFGRQSAVTLTEDTAEYLREETRDLVHRAEAGEWMEGVEALRDDVARLEARLNRLQRRLAREPRS